MVLNLNAPVTLSKDEPRTVAIQQKHLQWYKKNKYFLIFNCFPAHFMSICKNLQVFTNLLFRLFGISGTYTSNQISWFASDSDKRCPKVSE